MNKMAPAFWGERQNMNEELPTHIATMAMIMIVPSPKRIAFAMQKTLSGMLRMVFSLEVE